MPQKQLSRKESFVKKEYEGNYARETNNDFMFKTQHAFLNGALCLYPVIEHKKAYMRMFADKFISHGITSLLELGSGRGFNILSIAVLCPEIKKLRGVELTAGGVATAKANFRNPPVEILRYITGLDEKTIRERLLGRDIDFVEGSITDIPFRDGEFDAVFSNSVIEQIPRDYDVVFREAYRVATKAGFFSEPFHEAQRKNIFKLLHLRNIDYFRAPYEDVKRAGWKVFQFEIPPLQKFVFNTGLLSCVKKD